MRISVPLCLCVGIAALAGVQVSRAQTPASPDLLRRLEAIAALPGEPRIVSAGGVARSERRLLTLESGSLFEGSQQHRLLIVAGLDGDERGTEAALGAVRWFKASAPRSLRDAWTISALPMADPDGSARGRPFQFPPDKGFFDHPEQPESRYVWRWVTFQAPDLVVEIRGGDALASMPPPPDSLAAAISSTTGTAGGTAAAVVVTARATDGPAVLQQVLKAASLSPSTLHTRMTARAARTPLEIARMLATRYPQTPAVSYIPSVTWTNMLRLADVTKDASLGDAVRRQTLPWMSRERPLFGDRPSLTAAAGTMIYADLAQRGDESARPLAIQGADVASAEGANSIAQYGGGWTDDMFMSASILSRTGRMPGRERDLDRMASLLVSYAGRLQREDGIFVHFTDGRQAWGRGNGFAALGLMEALTSLPATHPSRAAILSIYRRQMNAMKLTQASDGMWRQVVDEPGSYREESVTAMTLSAMARGVRLGWLDQSFRLAIARAWGALAAHITEEGEIVDISASTGSGPTKRFYLDRPAIYGADDRGGAMAFLAAMEMYDLTR